MSECFKLAMPFLYMVGSAVDLTCSRPSDVLALPSDVRWCPSFDRFMSVCFPAKNGLLFVGRAPRILLPELDLSRLMASAADPLESCSAFNFSSLRDSLSHQNSHARESRARPL